MSNFVWYGLLILLCAPALLAVVYVLVRTGSIAHFRTRSEYERGEWRKKNGESGNG